MEGSKKLSQLTRLTAFKYENISIAVLDEANDDVYKRNAIMPLALIEARYVRVADYNDKFDARLSQKTSSNITEGSNLYWTDQRWETMWGGKRTTNLPEGTNLYYTEQRVKDNADVKANTEKRHDALTLNETALLGGLSLTEGTQVLNAKPCTPEQNGYLAKEDFIEFKAKARKNPLDYDIEVSAPLAEGGAGFIPNFIFPQDHVGSFEALIQVSIEATVNINEVIKVLGVQTNGNTWDLVVVSRVGNASGITLDCESLSVTTGEVGEEVTTIYGAIKYTLPVIAGFTSGVAKLRSCVISK